MSSFGQQLCYAAGSFLITLVILTFVSGTSESRLPKVFEAAQGGARGAAKEEVSAQVPEEELKRPANSFVSESELSHLGYTIERSSRKGLLYSDEDGTPNHYVDVQFVTVKRGGKVLGVFDADLYSGPRNIANFGFYRFLDDGVEQLFISQDIFRGGKQWVVSLSPDFKVIFNGDYWAVGREAWDIETVDIDEDGIYEIIAPTCIFYGFANLSPAGTPLPGIVFKYSKQSKRYLPANPQFSDHVLARAELLKSQIRPTGDPIENHNHLSDVLNVTLDYVFAGRQKEAWTFFDQAYKLPDKTKVKTEVQCELNSSPVYRFIYRRNTKGSRV